MFYNQIATKLTRQLSEEGIEILLGLAFYKSLPRIVRTEKILGLGCNSLSHGTGDQVCWRVPARKDALWECKIIKALVLWASWKALLSRRNGSAGALNTWPSCFHRFQAGYPDVQQLLHSWLQWTEEVNSDRVDDGQGTLVVGRYFSHSHALGVPFTWKHPGKLFWRALKLPSPWFRPHKAHGRSFMLRLSFRVFQMTDPPHN